jgi:3-phytase
MAIETISILDFGAVGDGKTDNTIAIQKAIDAAAASGKTVTVPAGTFRHDGLLKLHGVDIAGTGPASVLYATGAKQALQMTGNGGSITNLTLDSNATERSPGTAEEAKISVFEATNFEISNVRILNSMSTGMLIRSSSEGWIHHNEVISTGSDSIHMTRGSHDIRVENNVVRESGDDSIAVVSYGSQAPTHNIEITNNQIYDNLWGRGITVVGGKSVKIVNNLVDGNKAGYAGVYIASEADYNTLGVKNVLVQGNTILDTGGNHGSVHVYSETGRAMENIDILSNKVVPAAGASVYKKTGSHPADVTLTDTSPSATPKAYALPSWDGSSAPVPTNPAPTNPAPSAPAPSEPAPLPSAFNGTVTSVAKTGAVFGSGDVADDSAIWVNPTDASKSFVIGHSKAEQGGLHVYDLAGKEVFRLAMNQKVGGIDLVGDVLAVANRTTKAVDLFKIDASGKLTKTGSFATGMADVYGITIGAYQGKTYAFVSSQTGLVRQFEINGTAGSTVRDIKRSAITEGVVIDEANGFVYLAEEDKGIYKYGLLPSSGQTAKTVDTVGSNGIAADIEGLAVYDIGGKGYLIASSQGNDSFKVYDLKTDAYLGTFKVNGVTGTDGIEVTSANLGGAFAQGLLVVHDDTNPDGSTSNYRYVPWDGIQKLIGEVPTVTAPMPPQPTPTAPAPAPSNPIPPTAPAQTPTFSSAAFTGADAAEVIVGNALHNTIFGRDGNDTIYGGDGNDRLDGNRGSDVLHGGTGKDTFIIGSSGAMNEVILDFTKGQDRIDLGERDANTTRSGWQDFSFIGEQAFTKAGQLRTYQDAVKGVTIIEGNTDADLTAELHIECKGLITFSGQDFIL